MTLPRLLPFVSVHTENGIKLVLALLGPVLTTLAGHWRLGVLRRAAAPSESPRQRARYVGRRS